MRKIVDWDEVFEELYKDKDKKYEPYNISLAEVRDGLVNCFNKMSEEGWNLMCFIDDPILLKQYGFLFEKGDTVYKYGIIFLDKVTEEELQIWRDKGFEYKKEDVEELMDSVGICTPMYISSLRYYKNEENGFHYTLPIYVTKIRKEFSDEITEIVEKGKKEEYEAYLKETTKNAIFRGKETKAFMEWEKSFSIDT